MAGSDSCSAVGGTPWPTPPACCAAAWHVFELKPPNPVALLPPEDAAACGADGWQEAAVAALDVPDSNRRLSGPGGAREADSDSLMLPRLLLATLKREGRVQSCEAERLRPMRPPAHVGPVVAGCRGTTGLPTYAAEHAQGEGSIAAQERAGLEHWPAVWARAQVRWSIWRAVQASSCTATASKHTLTQAGGLCGTKRQKQERKKGLACISVLGALFTVCSVVPPSSPCPWGCACSCWLQ